MPLNISDLSEVDKDFIPGQYSNTNIAEPLWKQLAGMSLNTADLSGVDKNFIRGQNVGI